MGEEFFAKLSRIRRDCSCARLPRQAKMPRLRMLQGENVNAVNAGGKLSHHAAPAC
jgi:hypothetical protein